ncbi:MAG: hypothetical protein K2P70_01225 [Hyphomonadaceae bacterium]|nr:hypothetical protein [Hyphomonadaceae bacterium]
MNEWIITAASAGVVAFMVAVAFALGFRARAALDDASLAALATYEGDAVDAAVIAPNKRAAFARLRSGKLMIARVMGADVSTRVAPASTARVKLKRGKLSVAFADIGYPPLHLKLGEAPPWIAALAQGEAA